MISDARKEEYDAEHPVYFDANVWLTLYPPLSSEDDNWKKDYTHVLSLVLKKNVPIIIDLIVLGEYINRYCRIEYEAYDQDKKIKFKEFREKHFDYYKPIVENVVQCVHEIFELPGIIKIDNSFTNINFDEILNIFNEGKSDWNDLLIVDECKRNSYSLITNDFDFGDADINILTCNPKLLKSRKV